jgi:hypothetical protein
MIKSRRMRWAGHVARMGDIRNAYTIWVGKLKRPVGDLGVHQRIILKLTLKK